MAKEQEKEEYNYCVNALSYDDNYKVDKIKVSCEEDDSYNEIIEV